LVGLSPAKAMNVLTALGMVYVTYFESAPSCGFSSGPLISRYFCKPTDSRGRTFGAERSTTVSIPPCMQAIFSDRLVICASTASDAPACFFNVRSSSNAAKICGWSALYLLSEDDSRSRSTLSASSHSVNTLTSVSRTSWSRLVSASSSNCSLPAMTACASARLASNTRMISSRRSVSCPVVWVIVIPRTRRRANSLFAAAASIVAWRRASIALPTSKISRSGFEPRAV